jgi:hypothetical protein
MSESSAVASAARDGLSKALRATLNVTLTLINQLLASSEEMLLDPANLSHRLGYLGASVQPDQGASLTASESARSFLVQSTVRFGTRHMHQTRVLLGALSAAPPSNVWAPCKPLLLELLSLELDSTDMQSALGSLLDLVSGICSTRPLATPRREEVLGVLLKCLEHAHAFAFERALRIIVESRIGCELTDDESAQLLCRLLSLVQTHSSSTDTAHRLVQRALQSLPLRPPAVEAAWRTLLSPSVADSLLGTDTKAESQSPKRRRTAGSEVPTESSPLPSNSMSSSGVWQTGLIALLEVMQSRDDIMASPASALALARLLHGTLKLQLSHGATDAYAEYAKCLVLNLLRVCVGSFQAAQPPLSIDAGSGSTNGDSSKRRRRKATSSQSLPTQLARNVSNGEAHEGGAVLATPDDVHRVLACARTTQSPQTREAALLLMATLAEHFPSEMAGTWLPMLAASSKSLDRSSRVFNAPLVHKVVESVLPVLKRHGPSCGVSLCDVVHVFVDELDNNTIPAPHRLGVFAAVVRSLSHSSGPALGTTTLLLLGRSLQSPHSIGPALGSDPALLGASASFPDLCHSLCHRTSAAQQMDAIVYLLESVVSLLQTATTSVSDAQAVIGLSAHAFTTVRLGALRLSGVDAMSSLVLIIVHFISRHLDTPALRQRLLQVASSDEPILQSAYVQLCQQLLALMKLCSRSPSLAGRGSAHGGASGNADGNAISTKFPRLKNVLAPKLSGILDRVRALLSTPSFIAVVQELLADDDVFTRRKALEILHERLEGVNANGMAAAEVASSGAPVAHASDALATHEQRATTTVMSQAEQALCVEMLPDLQMALQSARKRRRPDSDGAEAGEHGEGASRTRICDSETALQATTILARAFAHKFASRFAPLLDDVARLLPQDQCHARVSNGDVGAEPNGTSESKPSASCYVCIATLCVALGPRAFPKLPLFLPPMLLSLEIESLQTQPHQHNTLLVQSVLSALASVTTSLPNFVHPYVKRILELLVSPAFCAYDLGVASTAVTELVDAVLHNLASHIQPRIVLPLVHELYPSSAPRSRIKLLELLQAVLVELPAANMSTHVDALSELIILALDQPFVDNGHRDGNDDISGPGSEAVAAAALGFVLKLSESELKPFLVKLHSWKSSGDRKAAPDMAALGRKAALYRVLHRVASALRGIFVPYLPIFWEEYKRDLELMISFGNDDSAVAASSSGLCATYRTLAHSLLSSLRTCLQHDSEGALQKAQLDSISQPLIELLTCLTRPPYASERATDTDNLAELNLVPCLGQLAACASASDAYRKALNFKLLMKTRSSHPAVRLGALRGMHACFEAVGEEYLVLLPECLPFLSELLEDTNPEIEALCRRFVADIEDLSGEDMDEFLAS